MKPSERLRNSALANQREPARAAHCVSREYTARVKNVSFFGAILILAILALSPLAFAQDDPTTPTEEIVVNLAAGRVVIAVVKDAILIGTVENPIEPQTHPPTPVQLGSERAGIILGAVDWTSPSAQKE